VYNISKKEGKEYNFKIIFNEINIKLGETKTVKTKTYPKHFEITKHR